MTQPEDNVLSSLRRGYGSQECEATSPYSWDSIGDRIAEYHSLGRQYKYGLPVCLDTPQMNIRILLDVFSSAKKT